MSERLMPSACEVDITGVVSMYALQLASEAPSALVDWNNNYGDEDDKCVLVHCGNWAKSFLPDIMISTAPILGSTLGVENTYGALAGRTRPGRGHLQGKHRRPAWQDPGLHGSGAIHQRPACNVWEQSRRGDPGYRS